MKQAEEIFQAAHAGGPDDCELAILVGRDGAIHMLAESDWGLEPLRMHYGPEAIYRIRRSGGQVRLEARSWGESCVLQSGRPDPPLRTALPDFPRYCCNSTVL